MYLNASTDKIEIVLGGTVATNQLQWNVSYQDITSSGMTLPQSGGAGLTNNATAVDIVAAPAASTTRQVTQINVYNADTATATVTIQKDVSGTNYVLMRIALTTLDVLMWSREDGWRVMSATGGGTTYTFSTGLTNTSGTVTANLSTGVAGGQSVVGGTAASNSLTLSSTSNATKGKILFGTSAYDEVNNRLGIGTASPIASQHIVGDSTANTGEFFVDRSSDTSSPAFITRRAGNTIASPTAVTANLILGVFGFRGYDGTAFSSGSRASLVAYASQNWTSVAQGTYFSFFTTPDGATTVSERMRIFQSGNVFIGSPPTDAGFRLDVNGTARVQTSLDTPIVRGGTGASGTLTLSSTSNATKGKILFGTSAYDEVNNRLGIGTQSPGRLIHTESESDTIDSSILTVQYAPTSATIAGGFTAQKARGTKAAPTALQAGDAIAGFFASGYHSGGSFGSNTSAIRFLANENFTSTAQGTRIEIATTSNGAITRTTRLTIENNGDLTYFDGGNIILGTTTGTKIATGNTQKLGFWNAAPIAQPTTAVAAATRVGGGGTTLTDTDTFDGYTLAQVVKALRNAGLLA